MDSFSSQFSTKSMDSSSCSFGSQISSQNRRSCDSPKKFCKNSPKKFCKNSPVVQKHLSQVFLSLCCALLASAAGVYIHSLCNVGGLFTFLASIHCYFCLKDTPFHQQQKKVFLLMVTALLEGATIGSLAQYAIKSDPSIVFSAFIGWSLAFGCFIGATMLAKWREHLYLGGLLSCLSIQLWLRLASFIFGVSMALLKYKLLLFVGFIVFDTDVIIEKAQLGDLDYTDHACTLFFHLCVVLVKVLN